MSEAVVTASRKTYSMSHRVGPGQSLPGPHANRGGAARHSLGSVAATRTGSSSRTTLRRTSFNPAAGPSSSRGPTPPALTPPYVRVRIRRFTRRTQASGAPRGSSRDPFRAACESAPPDSCGWPRRSTTGHARCRPRCKLGPWPVPSGGASWRGCVAASAVATKCSEAPP